MKMSIQKNNVLFGLPNKGNTCYMNTAIQTIIQIFSDFFISGEYYKKLSSNEKIIEFMSDFAHLVASVQNIDGRWKKTLFYLRLVATSSFAAKPFLQVRRIPWSGKLFSPLNSTFQLAKSF